MKTFPLEEDRIEWVKNLLMQYAQKGKPKFYEVEVDDFKVVEKTNDPEEFDLYRSAMNEGTDEVVITIFSGNSENSWRNKRYCFKADSKEHDDAKVSDTPLNGFQMQQMMDDQLDSKVMERISREKERWEQERILNELEQTKSKLKEAEEYIDLLYEELEEKKTKKLHVGDFNLGELASVVVEGMIRRNPDVISMIPGGEGLAGVFSKTQQSPTKANASDDAEVSFQRSEQDGISSEDDEPYIAFLRGMEERFSQQELDKIMEIIRKLADDPALILQVASLLDINP